MASTRQSREVKKYLAARRAQFRLKQTFDRIDWDEDVLFPELEAILSGKVHAELEADNSVEAQSVIDIHVNLPDETEARDIAA